MWCECPRTTANASVSRWIVLISLNRKIKPNIPQHTFSNHIWFFRSPAKECIPFHRLLDTIYEQSMREICSFFCFNLAGWRIELLNIHFPFLSSSFLLFHPEALVRPQMFYGSRAKGLSYLCQGSVRFVFIVLTSVFLMFHGSVSMMMGTRMLLKGKCKHTNENCYMCFS